MRRKGFESLGQPLKGRENIFVMHNKKLSYNYDNVRIFYSLDSAIDCCKALNKDKIFITGDGEIYKQAINFADKMIIFLKNFEAVGEVKYPALPSFF